jgi:N-acetylglucosaminyldiphosphoundecaprenol N-acetyl-beta-D-mannosaminyltransferase
MAKINVDNILFDNVTLEEALTIAKNAILQNKQISVYTPNPEMCELCHNNPSLLKVYNSADLVLPDGIGIIKAAKLLSTPLKERVAGVEFAQNLIALCSENNKNVYIFGGREGVAEKAKENLEQMYPGLNICGVHNGYVNSQQDNDFVVNDINNSNADVVLVCLGFPKQEQWIYDNRSALSNVKLLAGLGGSVDIFAGTAKRAPKLFINLHLEWFYRLLRNPSRIKRMMAIPRFMKRIKKQAKGKQ